MATCPGSQYDTGYTVGWTCSVYAISDGHGNVKFGVAKIPEKRMKEMQTGNAHPLQLLFECVCESLNSERSAVSGAYKIEHWIHEELAAKRMTGEWFAVDYQEAYEWMTHVVDWFNESRYSHDVDAHDVHIHTTEEQHIWYWPTSDVYERGLVQ